MLEGQVQTCGNGNRPIEHISGALHYDFLLFDYDLPGINGLELVHHVRKLVHRSRRPVGVFSATPVEAEAWDAGADVFLPKPQHIDYQRVLGDRRES
jgi:CheY-like chemotaxis protein